MVGIYRCGPSADDGKHGDGARAREGGSWGTEQELNWTAGELPELSLLTCAARKLGMSYLRCLMR